MKHLPRGERNGLKEKEKCTVCLTGAITYCSNLPHPSLCPAVSPGGPGYLPYLALPLQPYGLQSIHM
ncbi:hypothetical protein J6590_068500 [Homalodisca vitripennis]|nr:hypothetical protein J6590_068500 [Homalodisca vitripennis]